MAITQLPPLSLYVHVPWCVKKCPYCDFNSHAVKNEIPEEAYIDRLLFDLEQEMPKVWGRQLVSIFIGGGTPSLLSPNAYERLLSGIRSLLPFLADIEITMEANPGTVEANKFAGFVDAGINRLSIGVQSFNDGQLQSLGRIHSSFEAQRAFQIAREAGFNNINLDLMYALPNQSVAESQDDLKKAIDLGPEHLSWYQLTLEPNTLFFHEPPPIPDDEIAEDIAEAGLALLSDNRYRRYEVSAYSLDGTKPSTHNLNYWQFGDYLGIGAGAHGKITRADEQTISRTSKRRNPKDYLNKTKSLIDNSKQIPTQELPLEFMMNALRLKEGIPRELFFQSTGLLIEQISKQIKKACDEGLLVDNGKQIAPTEQGYRFLNQLLEHFMPENFSALASQQKIDIKSID